MSDSLVNMTCTVHMVFWLLLYVSIILDCFLSISYDYAFVFCLSGVKNPNLRILRDILLTYASFNPKLGYTQGMNDIAARFLVVMDNEVGLSLGPVNKIRQDGDLG